MRVVLQFLILLRTIDVPHAALTTHIPGATNAILWASPWSKRPAALFGDTVVVTSTALRVVVAPPPGKKRNETNMYCARVKTSASP